MLKPKKLESLKSTIKNFFQTKTKILIIYGEPKTGKSYFLNLLLPKNKKFLLIDSDDKNEILNIINLNCYKKIVVETRECFFYLKKELGLNKNIENGKKNININKNIIENNLTFIHFNFPKNKNLKSFFQKLGNIFYQKKFFQNIHFINYIHGNYQRFTNNFYNFSESLSYSHFIGNNYLIFFYVFKVNRLERCKFEPFHKPEIIYNYRNYKNNDCKNKIEDLL